MSFLCDLFVTAMPGLFVTYNYTDQENEGQNSGNSAPASKDGDYVPTTTKKSTKKRGRPKNQNGSPKKKKGDAVYVLYDVHVISCNQHERKQCGDTKLIL